jgi:hypothetical protein
VFDDASWSLISQSSSRAKYISRRSGASGVGEKRILAQIAVPASAETGVETADATDEFSDVFAVTNDDSELAIDLAEELGEAMTLPLPLADLGCEIPCASLTRGPPSSLRYIASPELYASLSFSETEDPNVFNQVTTDNRENRARLRYVKLFNAESREEVGVQCDSVVLRARSLIARFVQCTTTHPIYLSMRPRATTHVRTHAHTQSNTNTKTQTQHKTHIPTNPNKFQSHLHNLLRHTHLNGCRQSFPTLCTYIENDWPCELPRVPLRQAFYNDSSACFHPAPPVCRAPPRP